MAGVSKRNLKADNLSVADVGTVKEGQQIKDTKLSGQSSLRYIAVRELTQGINVISSFQTRRRS